MITDKTITDEQNAYVRELVDKHKNRTGSCFSPVCSSFKECLPQVDDFIGMYNPIGNPKSPVVIRHKREIARRIQNHYKKMVEERAAQSQTLDATPAVEVRPIRFIESPRGSLKHRYVETSRPSIAPEVQKRQYATGGWTNRMAKSNRVWRPRTQVRSERNWDWQELVLSYRS